MQWDHTVFYQYSRKHIIIFKVYADGITIFGDDTLEIAELKLK